MSKNEKAQALNIELSNLSSEELIKKVQEIQQEANEQRKGTQLAELYAIVPENTDDLTDLRQAQLFRKWAGTHIAYCSAFGWLKYVTTKNGGGHWASDADADVKMLYCNFLDEQFSKLKNSPLFSSEATKEELDKATTLLKFIRKCRGNGNITGVLSIVQAMVTCKAEEFDADGYLLNCQNGVVDLRTGKLREARPSDFMRHICAFDYVSSKPCGAIEWQQFLESVLVDEDGNTDLDYLNYMQLIAGLSAFGFVKVEKLFMAYGKGGNGKSTLFSSIRGALGDYAITKNSNVLIDDGKGNKQFSKADLFGARLVIMSELPPDVRLNSQLLKEVFTTDNIRAEYKFRDSFEFKPTHTGIMFTNDLPSIPATDEGTWDRLDIMPFNARFRNTSDERKNYTEDLLSRCGEAILSWVVDGAIMVHSCEFKFPQAYCVRNLTLSIRSLNNKAQNFVEAKCMIDGDGCSLSIRTKDLYEAYKQWCEQVGEDAVGKKKFRADIEQLTGVPCKHTVNGDVYQGIALVP